MKEKFNYKKVYYVSIPRLGETIEMTVNYGNNWELASDSAECLLHLQQLEKEDKIGITVKMAEMSKNVNDVADKFWKKIDYSQLLEELGFVVADTLDLLLKENLGKLLVEKI